MSEGLTPLQRAFLALQQAEARVASLEAEARTPIAVIGLGCRAPGGVHDAESFWRLLSSAGDAIGAPPAGRWDHAALYDPDPDAPGKIAATGGGFIDDVDQFDPAFFGLSPREAEGMDPQQRLLLEVAWETLENAGQAPDRLEGTGTGVYVGAAGSDYAYLQMRDGAGDFGPHFTSGIAHSVLSGRLSYLLGLQGPSVTIDTACSSSLVAVHLACQALRARECRLALAGGVNLILAPEIYIALSRARMLSPDGRCRTFDAGADGFGRAEGCAMLALKRLDDAELDGDRILAVIRGSAVNQDGPSSGLTAPNGPAQEAVIRAALAHAGVEPREVGYVEAHGTGTQLGDPLEAQALGAVFSDSRPPSAPLLISSVKTNIGHLEAAAGAIGLVKTVLSLQHQTIPAHPLFKTPSPHIAWDELALAVPAAATAWPEIDGRRIGGVSSFGFSGTNAHVVIEAAPAPAKAEPVEEARLFPLSAQNEAALRELAAATRDAIGPEASLADISRTLTRGRAHLRSRAVIRAATTAELRAGLDALAKGDEAPNLRTAETGRKDPPRLAFMFTGQGAQYAGMAARLHAVSPIFREAFDRCDAILTPLLARSLRESVLESDDAQALEQTGLAQPALFAVEYALAELLRRAGAEPIALIGHSVGEYVAAHLSGALELSEALRLIAVRGALMQSLPPGGAMAAVFADEARVLAATAPYASEVSIAAVNGPAQTVISGVRAKVEAICAALAEQGVKTHALAVSHAFHSPLTEPILDAFETEAAKVAFSAPQTRIVSNLTGKSLTAKEIASPIYWRRHLRETVRFADGLANLAAMPVDLCVEVGPHPALAAFAATVFEAGGPKVVPTLNRKADDWAALLDAVAELHLAGVEIDWRAVDPDGVGRPTTLPTARFQRRRYWFESTPRTAKAAGAGVEHPLLGTRLRSPLADVVQFEARLAADSAPFIADHVVQGRPIMPAAGMIDMALSAGRLAGGRDLCAENFMIAQPLAFEGEAARIVQTVVRRTDGRPVSFEIVSCGADDPDPVWSTHAQGDYAEAPAATAEDPPPASRFEEVVTGEAHYRALERRGLAFGPSLHGVAALRAGKLEALGEIANSAGAAGHTIQPALLDACLQVISAALPKEHEATFLPIAIERILFARTPAGAVRAHAVVREHQSSLIRADVAIYDDLGEVGRLQGVSMRPVREEAASDRYTIDWTPAQEGAGDAAWSPSVDALKSRFDGRILTLADEFGLESYNEAFIALETMSFDWIVRAFETLGWRPTAGEVVDAATLAARVSVAPRYHRLVARFLDILAEEGVLRPQGQGHVVVAWPVSAPVATAVPDQSAASQARLGMTAACGEDLAEILAGRVDPLERLFPGGSSSAAETLYRESPEAKAYNRLLGEAVAEVVARAPAGRKVRILEVGGGTGGSTISIAPQLPANKVEYVFTDVGPSLVERARQSFAGYGFMSFRTYDLESDPAGQGLEPESFDIIVAANVIHATADLKRTLGRLRTVLAPGGALFLLEVTGFERWIDITFGLTEGWWLFADRDLRPDYPLLARERWVEVLRESGFAAGEIGPQAPTSREALLVARRPVEGRRWAIVGQPDGLSAALGARLVEAGHTALFVDPASEPDLSDVDGVVHLGFFDIAPASAGEVLSDQQQVFTSLLTLVGKLGRDGASARLWIVTRGAAAAAAGDLPDPAQSTALGFRRAAVLEHPEWRPSVVDLDPEAPPAAQAEALFAQLTRSGAEQEVALRGDTALASRLSRLAPDPEPAPVRLEASASGVLDDLHLAPSPRRAPGPGEVEIRVHAAGLNFRDVMNALAMREDSEPLGGECAGVVCAIGEGVKDFAVGDPVVATVAGCFATYVTVDAGSVALKPRGLTHAQAAALPLVAMTARHALEDLAGLRAGQSILIHAGAGGVGLAAMQIARRAGATIFATAGSEAKRALLRELGAAQVFSSRTLDFEAGVLAATGGRGVDVVLNSLAGDFIGASVRALAEDGVFLEIGKQGIWSPDAFRAVRPKAAYHVIDLAVTRVEAPARWGAMFRDLMTEVEAGRFDPLPVRTVPLADAARAFAFMAQARQVGKIVLTSGEPPCGGFDDLDPAGVYLVTGGLAGLGLETASRLIERGARGLALVGRSPPGAEAQARIEGWRDDGVDILVLQADVGRENEIARVLAAIDATGRQLRGVFHSAGALSDGALLQQDWARFEIPLQAKVAGAWALHRLTRERRLDLFVLYSSIAGTLGSPGQANHAAANAFMDALAAHRRAIGLPATSIAWGAWSEVGEAAERGVDASVAARGIGMIAPAKGLETLEALAQRSPAHVAVSPIDWPAYVSGLGQTPPSFLERLSQEAARLRTRPTPAAADAPASDLRRELEAAAPAARRERLMEFVGRTVARVLGQAGADIDPRRPLNEMGLDSLLAVELRNRLGAGLDLGRGLPATLVFDCPTVEALADDLARRVAPEEPAALAPATAAPASRSALDSIDDLSDEEVEAMFSRMAGA